MNILRLLPLLLTAAVCGACSSDDAAPATAGGSPAAVEHEREPERRGGTSGEAGVVPGGAKVAGGFAEKAASMPLPAAVAVGPGAGPISPKALALRPETVQQAVLDSMGEAGRDVRVEVTRGVVFLSGEVDSVADFQRANYVARAVDGVIEVDQSRMRVRP